MPQTRRNVSDIVTTRLISPDGSRRAFCDQLCLDRYELATFTSINDAVMSDDPRRIVGSCVHCSWCGEVVARSADGVCRWHEPDDCPEWEPMASHHVAYAAKLLREHVGGPLSPRCWQYLTDHAALLREVGKLDARALVKHGLDTRIDWQTDW